MSGGVGPDAVGRVEGATVSNCRINRLWVRRLFRQETPALLKRNPGSVHEGCRL
ncbi:hypothetical protein ACIXMM_03695 [Bacteroides fragilis]